MEDRKSKKYMTGVYRYAFSRLVLHYTLYYEGKQEGLSVSEREQSVERNFNEIIKKFLRGEASEEELDQIRGQVEERVKILSAYSDCFHIYEYVLNRVERRFVNLPDSRHTPEEMAEELVECLAALEHGGERNSFLRNIISRLPVRFTRQKFYDMVTERFTAYTGLNRASVENFLHMLKTAAMADLPDNMEQEEELSQALACLKAADYRNLDKAGFDRCREMFSQGMRVLREKTDFYVSIQEMANELYMLVLTGDKRLVDAKEETSFRSGLERLQNGLETMDDLSGEELEEMLISLEGIQESAEAVVMSGGLSSDPVQKKLDKLVSGSLFVSLEEKETSEETADREWVDEQARELCRKLDKVFAQVPKAVTRSIMATVLSTLPVIFQNDREVEEYIRSSLESCADFAEREACLELLEQELMDFDVVV